MKIAVLGGGGTIGRAVVHELAEHEGVDRLSVFDADEEAVSGVVDAIQGEVQTGVVDATDRGALVEALDGTDAVANALPYAFNLDVMDACVAAKTHYLDLGGLYHTTREQLKLDAEFVAANRTAILGMGASPGLTNVAAAIGAKRLDRITAIHVRTGTSGGRGFSYSAKTILDEVTRNPVVYENGEFVEVEPLSGRETYVLPEPVGEVEGVYSIHSELATMPSSFDGVERVDVRVAFAPALLAICDALVEVGLTSEEEVEFEGVTTTPREFLDFHLGRRPPPESTEEWKSFEVDVIGERGGDHAHFRYTTLVGSRLDDWGLNASAVWTGVPMGVAAEIVARGDALRTGTVPPERAFDPSMVASASADRGVRVEETRVV